MVVENKVLGKIAYSLNLHVNYCDWCLFASLVISLMYLSGEPVDLRYIYAGEWVRVGSRLGRVWVGFGDPNPTTTSNP